MVNWDSVLAMMDTAARWQPNRRTPGAGLQRFTADDNMQA
jgi:hypothetical protein